MPESAKTRSKTVDEWVTDLTADLRLPWQRPAPDGRLTPARVRRGFRKICKSARTCPARPVRRKTAAKKNLTEHGRPSGLTPAEAA